VASEVGAVGGGVVGGGVGGGGAMGGGGVLSWAARSAGACSVPEGGGGGGGGGGALSGRCGLTVVGRGRTTPPVAALGGVAATRGGAARRACGPEEGVGEGDSPRISLREMGGGEGDSHSEGDGEVGEGGRELGGAKTAFGRRGCLYTVGSTN
jgi:hypothetical protein